MSNNSMHVSYLPRCLKNFSTIDIALYIKKVSLARCSRVGPSLREFLWNARAMASPARRERSVIIEKTFHGVGA